MLLSHYQLAVLPGLSQVLLHAPMPSSKLTASGDRAAAAVAGAKNVGAVGNHALPGFGSAAQGSDALSKNPSVFYRIIIKILSTLSKKYPPRLHISTIND
jgi:hypothetical protein